MSSSITDRLRNAPHATPRVEVSAEQAITPVPELAPVGDGQHWYWRERITTEEWDGSHEATKPPQKPWQGPLTAREMVARVNGLVEAGEIRTWRGEPWNFCCLGVLTPLGVEDAIWTEYPCTLANLEEVNARQPLVRAGNFI